MAKRKPETTVVREGISVSAPSPKRRIQGTVTENTQTIYANNTTVEASNWDVKIRLGLIQSATPELISVVDVAHVYMSHEHAKAFAEVLAKTLGQIEAVKQVSAAAKTQ
jgi:hypothetical protein